MWWAIKSSDFKVMGSRNIFQGRWWEFLGFRGVCGFSGFRGEDLKWGEDQDSGGVETPIGAMPITPLMMMVMITSFNMMFN